MRSVPVEGEVLLDRGRPPEVAVVRSLTADPGDIETLRPRFATASWWSEQGINKGVAVARGAYKRKACKINPVDIALPDGSVQWEEHLSGRRKCVTRQGAGGRR